MRKVLSCRRSTIALVSICCLTAIALTLGTDVGAIALAISGICGSICGANAWQSRSKSDK